MTLIKFKNGNTARNYERMPYISEFFNDLFDNVITPDIRRTNVPAVNIVETDEHYKLEMAAPGMKKEDFRINIENDMLTISSEEKKEETEQKEKYTRKEFSFSSFQRSFSLPELVDYNKIEAKYENGMMIILLPKKEEAKMKAPREIKIS